MLVEAANQVAPVVSEARTLDRFIAPAQEKLWALARNVWWSWDQDCVSLFRDLNPVRWRKLNQNPITLLNEMPLGEIERGQPSAYCTAASTMRTAASGSISPTIGRGARATPACCGRGRWRIFRLSLGCTSRCRSTREA